LALHDAGLEIFFSFKVLQGFPPPSRSLPPSPPPGLFFFFAHKHEVRFSPSSISPDSPRFPPHSFFFCLVRINFPCLPKPPPFFLPLFPSFLFCLTFPFPCVACAPVRQALLVSKKPNFFSHPPTPPPSPRFFCKGASPDGAPFRVPQVIAVPTLFLGIFWCPSPRPFFFPRGFRYFFTRPTALGLRSICKISFKIDPSLVTSLVLPLQWTPFPKRPPGGDVLAVCDHFQ